MHSDPTPAGTADSPKGPLTAMGTRAIAVATEPARTARRELGGAVRRSLVHARSAAVRSSRAVDRIATQLPSDPSTATPTSATLLFIDICSYSALPPDDALTAVGHLDDTVRGQADCRVVKRLGDGILLHHTGPDPLRAAADIVGDFARRSGLHAAGGVSAGTCHDWDGDLFGPPVNRAARLASLAGPDEVLADADAIDPDRVPSDATRRTVTLRGIADDVAVWALPTNP